MAEEEGFEPPRAVKPLSVFKTDPFSRAWVFLRNLTTKYIISVLAITVNMFTKLFYSFLRNSDNTHQNDGIVAYFFHVLTSAQ